METPQGKLGEIDLFNVSILVRYDGGRIPVLLKALVRNANTAAEAT